MSDMVEKIADCLVDDHVELLRENKRLREALMAIVGDGVQRVSDDLLIKARQALMAEREGK